MTTIFNEGDKIIWDSHFGYEVGYFLGESDRQMYNTYKVDLVTGICQGKSLRSKEEIKPYSENAAKELSIKYGCNIKL